MKSGAVFLMAGGGTGGHVIPGLAVARELKQRGHRPFFVGTRGGLEARLVPAEGFEIEWIHVGGLKRVGLVQRLRTLAQLPFSIWTASRIIGRRRPAAMFSVGGYAAGPAVLAAWLRRVPFIVMEPNAMPGFTNRRMGRFAARALLGFSEAAAFFPRNRSEVTGLPVRREFFEIRPKQRAATMTVMVTGGSRGSRALNQAARASWPLFRDARFPVRWIQQAGADMCAALEREFADIGIEGEVRAFISDMPAVFTQGDLVVCRSGAGAVAELAAAGKPSILVPFPYAADQHQLRNAEVMARAGAARLVLDGELSGERLFQEVTSLWSQPALLDKMGEAARRMARPGAAERAADLLEQAAHVSSAEPRQRPGSE
jgi:UDP-N-acetylglucosamine--N-acetylmuramyl-(pentapeptide) pyrophosphoryl-undecaprenol N-acetylglucosamine transferase